MVRAMTAALQDWLHEPAAKLILIDHAEGRGFCAGGDVVTIAKSSQGHGAAGQAFFFQEYRMNHLMYTYPKRGVVFMDGIVMGGGVGISCPCKYRIATERTVFAMPETSIGLFPDVGGGRYLSRLRGRIAQFLALTGARLDGAECVALGLATHYIPSDRLEEVKRQLIEVPEHVEAILRAASVEPPPARIVENYAIIDRCFASDRLEDILAALEADGSDWAHEGAGDARHQIADRLQGLAPPARRKPAAVPLPRRDAVGIWHRRAHVPPSGLHRRGARPADRQGQCAAVDARRRRKR